MKNGKGYTNTTYTIHIKTKNSKKILKQLLYSKEKEFYASVFISVVSRGSW